MCLFKSFKNWNYCEFESFKRIIADCAEKTLPSPAFVLIVTRLVNVCSQQSELWCFFFFCFAFPFHDFLIYLSVFKPFMSLRIVMSFYHSSELAEPSSCNVYSCRTFPSSKFLMKRRFNRTIWAEQSTNNHCFRSKHNSPCQQSESPVNISLTPNCLSTATLLLSTIITADFKLAWEF